MKGKAFSWAVAIMAVLALAAGSVAHAQRARCMRFHGTVNDYTPASTGGPWEMRGTWSLVLHENSGLADFSAELNMEQSDEGIINMAIAKGDTADPTVEFNTPALRGAHTHHIVLEGKSFTKLANGGYQVSGPINLVTKDGTRAVWAVCAHGGGHRRQRHQVFEHDHDVYRPRHRALRHAGDPRRGAQRRRGRGRGAR